MTRLLCVGDLHLGKGASYSPTRLQDQEAVWARALELSRERACDAVLFAGDAFDKANASNDAGLAFKRPLVAHNAAGGPHVYAIVGNHDRPAAQGATRLEEIALGGRLDLAAEAPVLTMIGGRSADGVPDGVALFRLPWVSTARLRALAGGGDVDDVNEWAAALLLNTARKTLSALRERSDAPAVLLMHYAISDDIGGIAKFAREPILDLATLSGLGYDAVVSGHFHRGDEPLAYDPPVLFVGSPMPLDFGEAGYEHGVWIVELDDTPPVRRRRCEFVPIESRRFVAIDVDLTLRETEEVTGDPAAAEASLSPPERPFGQTEPPAPSVSLSATADATDRLAAAIAEHLPLDDAIVKVTYTVADDEKRAIDARAIRKLITDAGAHRLWLLAAHVVRTHVEPTRLSDALTPAEVFAEYMAAQGVNGDRGDRLAERVAAYLQEVTGS